MNLVRKNWEVLRHWAAELEKLSPDVAAPFQAALRDHDRESLYERGKEALIQRQWKVAVDALEQLEQQAPHYRDAAALLAKARAGRAREEETHRLREVEVRPDGSGDYPTLEEAIEAVPAGWTVRLGRGKYRLKSVIRELRIEKTLSLIGAGMEATKVIQERTNCVINYVGSGKFTAAGITFHLTGTESSTQTRYVAIIEAGEVLLKECRFKTGRNAAGLALRGHATGLVQGCECVGDDQSVGIEVGGRSTVTLQENRCQGNYMGLLYHENAGGLAVGNECVEGIRVSDEARPTLERNRCRGGGDGIRYSGNAGGVAKDNHCEEVRGGPGIRVEGSASPTLEGNHCQGVGIGFYENARGLARGNDCTRGGISVDGQAQVTLERNDCSDSRSSCISFRLVSGGVARENDCSRGRTGIERTRARHPKPRGHRAPCRRDDRLARGE